MAKNHNKSNRNGKYYEFELKKISIRSGTIRDISSKFLTAVTIVGVAFFTYLSIKDLSGKTTIATFFLNLIANAKFSITISYVITGSALIYAFRERKLRKRNIKRFAPRIKKLEEEKNPRRGSSNLTPGGKTRKEDKIA